MLRAARGIDDGRLYLYDAVAASQSPRLRFFGVFGSAARLTVTPRCGGRVVVLGL